MIQYFWSNKWIIESSASVHMASNINLYHSLSSSIKSPPIELPNNTIVQVISVWIIGISPDVKLQNVFYVPTFNVNLLSVERITREINYFVTFYPTFCVFMTYPWRRWLDKVGSKEESIFSLKVLLMRLFLLGEVCAPKKH